MLKRVFELDNGLSVAISAPETIMRRVEENLDARSAQDCETEAVAVINAELRGDLCNEDIRKKEGFPYISVREQTTNAGVRSFAYWRYDINVREIRRKEHSEYQVSTSFRDDEEGVLLCVRNLLYYHKINQESISVHGSLININGRGILVIGHGRSGKTSLIVKMLTETGGSFVSDERVLLAKQDGGLFGVCVPDVVKVRFSSLVRSPLDVVLENIGVANATQYIDVDALQKIIAHAAYDVDAGISFSRDQFVKLLHAKSLTKSRIDKVIFPIYREDDTFKSKRVSVYDAFTRINDCRKATNEIHELGDLYGGTNGKVTDEMLSGMELLEIGFNQTSLGRQIKLEELLWP